MAVVQLNLTPVLTCDQPIILQTYLRFVGIVNKRKL